MSAKIFDRIKRNVQKAISQPENSEITSETDYKSPGIYMLYIDDFSDNRVVPIYIGRSADIQKRYKNHFSELATLNRLPYNEYKKYCMNNMGSFYNGRYKTVKLFKYMVEHGCTINDFRMIILEKTENNIETLEKREQYHFNKYFPAFVGMNQMNSTTELPKATRSEGEIQDKHFDNLVNYMKADLDNVEKFYEYGHTEFNYKYSFPRDYDRIFKEKFDHYEDDINIINKKLEVLDKKTGYIEFINEAEAYKDKWESTEKRALMQREMFVASLVEFKKAVEGKLKELKVRSKNPYIWFMDGLFNKENRNKFYKYMTKRDLQVDLYKELNFEVYEVKRYKLKLYTRLTKTPARNAGRGQ